MRLLLIDDEPLIGAFVRRIAETSGFEVQITTQADTFKAACISFQPDVISLDLSMPDCDGIELLRYLAEIKCQAHILIASGFDSKMLEAASDLGEARGLKMAGVIPKPMRVAQVRALFDRLRPKLSDG
jgi:DNA-binding response OmpR family regulator